MPRPFFLVHKNKNFLMTDSNLLKVEQRSLNQARVATEEVLVYFLVFSFSTQSNLRIKRSHKIITSKKLQGGDAGGGWADAVRSHTGKLKGYTNISVLLATCHHTYIGSMCWNMAKWYIIITISIIMSLQVTTCSLEQFWICTHPTPEPHLKTTRNIPTDTTTRTLAIGQKCQTIPTTFQNHWTVSREEQIFLSFACGSQPRQRGSERDRNQSGSTCGLHSRPRNQILGNFLEFPFRNHLQMATSILLFI